MNDDPTLPPGARRITREEYVELLVDSWMTEADSMAEGFGAWAESHAATWHEAGRDEEWIRLRVDSAQATRRLHETLKAKGFTRTQCREVVRQMYVDAPEMYDLMIERERTEPHVSIIYGTPNDLVQRAVLRILLYEADKANYARYCRWAHIPEGVFQEGHDDAFIRDFSGVEELELLLQMAQRAGELFDDPTPIPPEEMGPRMEAAGHELRVAFIAKHGYAPELSTTPRIPVTPEGPVDPEVYHRQRGEE